MNITLRTYLARINCRFTTLEEWPNALEQIQNASAWKECGRVWETSLLTISLEPVPKVTSPILKATGIFQNGKTAMFYFLLRRWEGRLMVTECDENTLLRNSEDLEIRRRVPPPRWLAHFLLLSIQPFGLRQRLFCISCSPPLSIFISFCRHVLAWIYLICISIH